jgi:hypothetical protein
LFLQLLLQRHEGLADAVIGSIKRYGRDHLWPISVELSDINWWVEWIGTEHRNWAFRYTLGGFLALGTREPTRRQLIDLFNESPEVRPLLSETVFSQLPGLSILDLSDDSIEWLLGNLNHIRYSHWPSPLLTKVATEEFVQERLIPLYLENPPDPLHENLRLCLEDLGRAHRRRYIGDDGQLLG